MANIVPIYVNGTLITARKAESDQSIPDASWDGGLNAGASNACGIGIGTQTDLAESLPSWTLLDQAEAARTPQDSQSIGEAATPIEIITNSANGDGIPASTVGDASLVTLAAGWVAV